METTFFRSFPKKFEFVSLCSFICLQVVFQDLCLCARLLGVAALRILLLTFTSRFVIDFLSIRKVIISPRSLPMIVTPYGHVLYIKCCKLHDDSFPLYCATEGGTENLLRTLM